MHALADEETSIVVPFFQLIPVFGYIFGYVFLGEILSIQQIIAAGIVILGAIILSLEFNEEQKLSFKKKALVFMVVSTLLIAFSEVLFKLVAIEEGSFWSSLFWNYSGLVLVGLILFIFVRNYRLEFLKLLRTSGKTILSINVSSEIVTILGNIFFGYATLLAPIALVMTVNAYQPGIVLVLGVLLTLYAPHIYVEKITTRHLMHKGGAIAVMFFASYFLY
jgi:drug/metabolite transporter (DMT)-like permease